MKELYLLNMVKELGNAGRVERYFFLVDDKPQNIKATLRKIEEFMADFELSLTDEDRINYLMI